MTDDHGHCDTADGCRRDDSAVPEPGAVYTVEPHRRCAKTYHQQNLDVAAGTGELGLSIVRVSPKGRVVLTDLVAETLAQKPTIAKLPVHSSS